MNKSTTTKRAIAAAFSRLLETTAFEKVTVSAIAAECGVNRQTFYYHFHDIYDLVGWMLDDETATALKKGGGNWRDSLESLLTSLRGNKRILRYRMRSADPYIMYHMLRDRLTAIIMRDQDASAKGAPAAADQQSVVVDFYVGGLVEIVITWLENDCVTTPAEMVAHVEHILTHTPSELLGTENE